MNRLRFLLALISGVLATATLVRPPALAAAPEWQARLSPPMPGNFPLPRPLSATYRCGWSGLPAATVEVEYSRPKKDVLQVDAEGGTIGLARTLWRLDATHSARADASRLQPIETRQVEKYRGETVRTALDFSADGVTRVREKSTDGKPAKPKRVELANLHDLHSALLYVRSQKLARGQTFRFVVYPATSPYLATVRVIGREKVEVRAGTFPAIKLDLRLQKIGKDMKLEPHTNFRRGTGWISDNSERLLLRVEAEIFVGSVWAELASVKRAG